MNYEAVYKTNKYYHKFMNANSSENKQKYLSHMQTYCQKGGSSEELQKLNTIISELKNTIEGSESSVGLLTKVKNLKDKKDELDTKIIDLEKKTKKKY